MRILKLQAENIKRLKAIEVVPDPEKGLVVISGANDQGKTSLLDSIFFALGGKRAIQAKPVREGQEEAAINLDLGDYLVERIWRGENTYLKVQNKEGAVYSSPQALLDKLIGDLTFDPLAFANSDKEVQIKTLQGIINLPFDAEDFKRTVRMDIRASSENPLEFIQENHKMVFALRTQVGRDLKNAQGAWESLAAPEEQVEAVSVTDLFSQRKKLEEEKSHRTGLVDGIDGLENVLEEKAKSRNTLIREILEYKHAIQAAQEKLKEMVTAEKETGRVLGAKRDLLGATPCVDFTEIDGKISLADETNNQAGLWKSKQEAREKIDDLDVQRKELTGRLKAIEDYRDNLVSKADMPVEGLGFGEGSITYKGIPFEQVGSAMRLRISTAVAMALNPTLRVIRVTDGSLLDSESLKLLEELADKNDFQVWVEIISEDGKVGVYIEDGNVKYDNYKTA